MLNIDEDNQLRPVKGRGSEKSKRPGAIKIKTFNIGRPALVGRARRREEG